MEDLERERLKSEVATLHQLLEVHETTALEQAIRADAALSDLRQIAEAHAQQARQIRELVEASSESVILLDEHWTVQYMNTRAMKEVSESESLVGRNFLEVFPDVVGTLFHEKYLDAMNHRTAQAFEEFYGPFQRNFAVGVSPVGLGIAIFFRDVTERRRQQEALARTEKLAAVGRLASSISHEINNPLESVVNLLYLIEHSTTAGEQARTYASLAAAEMQRVSHIVTQTLKFHRQSTHAAECRVSEILDSVVSLFQGRMSTLRVQVERRYCETDRMVCFAGDIRQVFANLIGNALDAMNGEGTLRLRTRRTHDWKTGRGGMRILVADTGCGMSEEARRRLFEPFFTTKPTTGTGLGLWVSDEIIRNHDGVVRVRSSQRPERSGTTFTIFFPDAD